MTETYRFIGRHLPIGNDSTATTERHSDGRVLLRLYLKSTDAHLTAEETRDLYELLQKAYCEGPDYGKE